MSRRETVIVINLRSWPEYGGSVPKVLSIFETVESPELQVNFFTELVCDLCNPRLAPALAARVASEDANVHGSFCRCLWHPIGQVADYTISSKESIVKVDEGMTIGSGLVNIQATLDMQYSTKQTPNDGLTFAILLNI